MVLISYHVVLILNHILISSSGRAHVLSVIQGLPDSPKRVKKLVSSTIFSLNEAQSVNIGGRGVDFSMFLYAILVSEETSNERMFMA